MIGINYITYLILKPLIFIKNQLNVPLNFKFDIPISKISKKIFPFILLCNNDSYIKRKNWNYINNNYIKIVLFSLNCSTVLPTYNIYLEKNNYNNKIHWIRQIIQTHFVYLLINEFGFHKYNVVTKLKSPCNIFKKNFK